MINERIDIIQHTLLPDASLLSPKQAPDKCDEQKDCRYSARNLTTQRVFARYEAIIGKKGTRTMFGKIK